MKYSEFLEKVKQQVEKNAGEEVCVKINSIYKNNIHPVDGMTILRQGENVSPAIYLNGYYEQCAWGVPVSRIAEEILEYHERNRRAGNFDVSFYTDFEKVKGRLACKLIHYGKNLSLLGEIPHRAFFDLAVVYYYKMDSEVFGKASILVKNEHMEMWKKSEPQLHAAAMENTLRLLPCEFTDLVGLIQDMMEDCEMDFQQDIPMYVLSNTEKNFGASLILYSSVLEQVARKIGRDYFVLPSSIHECIIVPALPGIIPRDLHEMVREINDEHVEPEEILGDSVYRYDREKKQLVMAYQGGTMY